MNISKKRELPQTTFNHSSNTDFEDSMNFYSSKPYFLMLDSIPAPDNPVYFRKTCLERIYKQLMRIRLGIKIQYGIYREASEILLSYKIDKYEYLTGEEILPSNQKIELKNKP